MSMFEDKIIELIRSHIDIAKEQKWSVSDWKKFIIDVATEDSYKKTEFHSNVIDQIMCQNIPKLNKNRFRFRKTRNHSKIDKENLDRLLKIPRGHSQKSAGWNEERHNRINASEANGVLGNSRSRMLLFKSLPHNANNVGGMALEHGNRYECIAQDIFSIKTGKKVHEFDSIPHQKYHFLAASPDGIDEDGVLIEIKCPLTREIIGAPKPDYWVQMQLQMEVCDLSECNFVECKIKEFDTKEDYLENTQEYSGIIVEYFVNDSKKRVYSETNIKPNKSDDWIEAQIVGIDDYNIIYWYLDVYSCFKVFRDVLWFKETLPLFEEFWKEVEKYRENGNHHEIQVKRRKPKETETTTSSKAAVCLIDDDDYASCFKSHDFGHEFDYELLHENNICLIDDE